jgi:hypothetical protein
VSAASPWSGGIGAVLDVSVENSRAVHGHQQPQSLSLVRVQRRQLFWLCRQGRQPLVFGCAALDCLHDLVEPAAVSRRDLGVLVPLDFSHRPQALP